MAASLHALPWRRLCRVLRSASVASTIDGKGREKKKGSLPVDDQCPPPAAVVDGVFENPGRARRLDDNVEAVGVVLLDLVKLRRRVGPGQLDVVICCVELLGQIQLESSRCGDGYLAAAVLAEELGQHLGVVVVRRPVVGVEYGERGNQRDRLARRQT